MNNTTLGYFFIDNPESEQLQNNSSQTKVVPTQKILNKLKPSQKKALNEGSRVKLDDSQPLNVSAFGEYDDEPVAIQEKPRVSPLLQSIETFGNYDMSNSNKGHYTTHTNQSNTPYDTLYDFRRHMNNTEIQPTTAMDNSTHEKINYIIHMLEQNRQLRTENIAEDMVLYFFLGFFVLYVSENFVKMGKYTR